MMKSTFIILLLFAIYPSKAQFEKTTPNGSYLVSHINKNNDLLHGMRINDEDIALTMFDLKGNIQWSKILLPFEDNGIERDLRFRRSNELAENGDFIFSGILDNPDGKVVFSKINKNGEVDFSKILRYPPNFIPLYTFTTEHTPKLIAYDDDTYLIMNYFLNEDQSNLYYFFVKFNSMGEISRKNNIN